MKQYDAIVIGSGQAGTPLAGQLAKAGYKTALIEKKHIGGTCINDGCIPSKTLIASARRAHHIAFPEALGIRLNDTFTVDFPAIMQRKRDIVQRFRNGSLRSLQETSGLDLVFGSAAFSGARQLTVTDSDGNREQYSADLIFINTGARAAIPAIQGLDKVPWLDSTSLLELDKLPEHLLILGAGYISLEMAQAFRRFGAKVTILESAPHILGHEDEDIQKEISSFLEEEHITILTGATVESCSRNSMNDIVLHIDKEGTKALITGSHLLLATGRIPNTEELQPALAGIDTDDKGYIKVDDRLETNVAGIYALGDVKGGPAFTHISYNDYRTVFRNLTGQEDLSVEGRLVPYCMFTDPELGRVGLTETEARAQGYDIAVATLPMDKAARGIIEHRTRGLMKAVIDKKTKKILGAALLCMQGGEIMSVLQMAMQAGFTYEQVREHMFAHPTLSESLNNLFFSLEK